MVLLPSDIDAEMSLLAACMINPESLSEVLEMIKPGDFYRSSHQAIFQLMSDRHRQGLDCDAIGLRPHLNGSASQLGEILATPTPASLKARCLELRRLRVNRDVLQAGQNIMNLVANNTQDVVSEAQKIALTLRDDDNSKKTKSAKTMMTGFIDHLEAVGKKEKPPGVMTGFRDIDLLIRGFQPSDLIIIAARPSMGKTAWVVSAIDRQIRLGIRVGVFSLEMSQLQLVTRLAAINCQIDAQRFKTAKFDQGEWDRILKYAGDVSQKGLYINDNGGLSISNIYSEARKMVKYGGAQIIYIDYLQLVTAGDKPSRHEEVAVVSRTLKAIAKDLDVPVVALSQLNRELEYRNDKRPKLSDLRESGQIEQDADVVAFIYRDEVYNPKTNDKGIAEISISKHRNGPCGVVRMAWRSEYTQFSTLERS